MQGPFCFFDKKEWPLKAPLTCSFMPKLLDFFIYLGTVTESRKGYTLQLSLCQGWEGVRSCSALRAMNSQGRLWNRRKLSFFREILKKHKKDFQFYHFWVSLKNVRPLKRDALCLKRKGLLKGGRDEILGGCNMDPSAHYGTWFPIDNLVTRIVGRTHFPVLQEKLHTLL